MALHEVHVYPEVIDISPEDRVLQQHSLYWAVSAYGELDTALVGCALVSCEAWDAERVASAVREHGATHAGLVLSILAALDHKLGGGGYQQAPRCWARQPHSEAVLRRTLEQLTERHVALRSEMRDPYELFQVMRQALSALKVGGGTAAPTPPAA